MLGLRLSKLVDVVHDAQLALRILQPQTGPISWPLSGSGRRGMADPLMAITEKTAVPKKPDSKEDPSNTIQMKGDPEDRVRLTAQIAVTPSLQAASTIKRWSNAVGDLDITRLIGELRQQATDASGGDLKRQEATLAIQAHTLDTIFNELARRAHTNMGEYVDAADRYMRLALRAQNQCRATIETLAEIKNPKSVAFVQQANIANGPQQVNNGPQPAASRAREENQPNKLLEQQHNEWLDAGTAQATGNGNSTVEALGAIHGTKNDRG